MNRNCKKVIYTVVGAFLFVLMALTPALCSTIDFGGTSDDKDVHLHSQGRINFMWVPITNPDSGSGDPVGDSYWGAVDLNVFDATGLDRGDLNVGDTYDGFDYSFAMFIVDEDSRTNIKSNDRFAPGPDDAQYYGTMHLTSISFPSDYEINLNGYLDNTTNNLLTSTALNDLQNGGNINFAIDIVANDRSSGSFVDVLNSGNDSSWADLSGSLDPSTGGGAVPEPGTFVLFSSVMAVGAWIKRRRGQMEG